MKFAEIIIKPISAFGTPLKGDTIFGHFYWQLIYDPSLINRNLDQLSKVYGHEPFVIFSSAFPRLEEGWLFPRPALPLHRLNFDKKENERGDCFQNLKQLKARKAKKWIFVRNQEGNFKIDLRQVEFLTEEEATKRISSKEYFPNGIKKLIIRLPQPHNSINRLTFTTGEGFAPYQMENFWFHPRLKLSVFFLYKEEILPIENIKKAFQRIGEMGFGRDASSGLGLFGVEEVVEHQVPAPASVLYTLSPYVPQQEEYKKILYQPFVRFGRHGSYLVLSENPFKNPVFMADEGAVLETVSPKGPYVGRALDNLSKTEEKTIGQGFSIVFPLEGLL